MTTPEEQNKIENNEILATVPENIEEKEISPEEFLEIANTEEQNFKQETTNEISKLNSVELDHQTFENIKNETGVEIELNNLNQDAVIVIEDSKNQVAGTETINEAEYSTEDDPRFRQMLEKEAYFRLKTYDKDYFDKNFSGLSEKGYLIDLDGKETMSTPLMNIGGKTGDLNYSEFINITKQKFFNEYPDAKEKEDQKLKLQESVKNEEIKKIFENPNEDPFFKNISDDVDALMKYKNSPRASVFYQHIEKFVKDNPEKAKAYLKYGEENYTDTNSYQPSWYEQLKHVSQFVKLDNKKEDNTSSKEDIKETQNTPEVQEKYENREVSDAFKEAGMPLDWKLVGMLEESQEHQGGRRGSGFTQASRYMADIVRSERSSKDFKIFDNSFRDEIEDGFFKNGNQDKLKTVDFRDYVDKNKLKEISSKIKGPGSKILLGMISDIFNSNNIDTNLSHLPSSKEKMEIGTCTTAENYFFDYMRGNTMYGDNFENKRAKMNIFKDEKGEPLFMEKIGLGENHSAISLKDFYLNGIKIPAGSLVALQYDKPSEGKLTSSGNGNILDSKILQAVEFLRFTTLVVNPKDREQTFGEHLKWQKEQDIKGAEDLTLNEVIDKCKKEVSV